MRTLMGLGICVLLLLGAPPGPAAAADTTPAQHFSANMAQVKASIEAFSQTVTRYNGAIQEITRFDAAAAKQQVEEIRGALQGLVAQIANDSELARSQVELVQWIERNRRLVRADPTLSGERKALLLEEWGKRADTVTAATTEIQAIRKELAEQLASVTGDESYLTQLVLLEKADEANGLVRDFLNQIKSFADTIRERLKLVPVPTS